MTLNTLQDIQHAIETLTSPQVEELLLWLDTYAPHLAEGHARTDRSTISVGEPMCGAQAESSHEHFHYQKLVARAVQVFGDEARASLWLSTPSVDLAGQAPLKVAQEDGYSLKRLESLFTRIEHGVDF